MTSVESVVTWDAVPSNTPASTSTSAPLVNVEPTSTQTTRCGLAATSGERAGEVLDEVVDRLDADREPDQVRGNLERRAGHRGVRHPARVLDERLDPAERLAEREDLGPVADLDRCGLPTGDAERHHAAERLHLLDRNVVAG